MRETEIDLPTDVRVYRSSLAWRIGAICLAAVGGCGGILIIYWSIFGDPNIKPGHGWLLFSIGAAVIAVGVFIVTGTLTSEAIYDANAVEIRCAIPFQTGRMLRRDIAAKMNVSVYMPTYMLYPKDRTQRKLQIWVPTEDEFFRSWIEGIPDADSQFLRARRKSTRQL